MKDKISKLIRTLKELEYNNLYPLFFTLIFILILIQYSFHSLDAIFYDFWTRSDFMTSMDKKIVTITIDEESDQFLGEKYPYTYATHVRLMKRLIEDKPRAIGYLTEFYEPKTEIDLEDITELKKIVNKFKTDSNFFRIGVNSQNTENLYEVPLVLRDLGASPAPVDTNKYAFAKDGVTRRAMLNISGEDTLHLWMANKYQELYGKDILDSKSYSGSFYDLETDSTYALFKYHSNPLKKNSHLTIPYHRVVVGNFPAGFFKNKIILIGPSYISNPNDFVLTPYGKGVEKASKMAIHAQIMQALLKNETIFRVPTWITDLISILVALFLSFIISKVQPAKGLIITMSIMLGIFAFTYLSFVFIGVWFEISHLILSIFVVYYIWVPFRAIGEYQTRYAIQEETKVLKKVDKLKQNFLSLMSHDLKTPVAKIAGIADILKVQYDNNPRQIELLTDIVDSTKELNNFITSILDLTKIESRELALKLESKDVNPLIESTVNGLRFEAAAKEMKIELNLAPLYPIKVDTNLINRVFGNIIGNAIKYAGHGKQIKITTEDDEKWVYITIEDDGKGISQEDLDNIFEKFYRVKDDESHKIKGSGLGLYLVKYFIELHQGMISVESNLNEGTKFLIKLKNE